MFRTQSEDWTTHGLTHYGPLRREEFSTPVLTLLSLRGSKSAVMRKRALESNQTTQRDWEAAIIKMAVSMLVFVFMYVFLVRIVYKLSGVLTKWVKKSPFHSLMNNPCKKFHIFDTPLDFLVSNGDFRYFLHFYDSLRFGHRYQENSR